MTTARDIAHRYARKAHMCQYARGSDKHQEHSAFCDALCADIKVLVTQTEADTAAECGLVVVPRPE